MKTLFSLILFFALSCVAAFHPVIDNVSKDGTNSVFVGKVSGADPTANANYVTKGYADANYAGGGGGGITGITNRNVNYVGKNGNDSTGTSNRLDKPFLTIGMAKTNSHPGDLIYVLPGVYNENDLATNNINYYFAPGAIVAYTGSGHKAIFDDSELSGGMILNIDGYGLFTNSTSWSDVQAPNIAVLTVSNAASKVNIRCQGMYGINEISDTPRIVEIYNCASVNIKCNELGGTYTTGLYWEGGDNIYFSGNIVVGQYSVWEHAQGTDPINWYIDSDFINGEIIADGNNPEAVTWVECKLNTYSGDANVKNAGQGKLYVHAQKLWQQGISAVIGADSGKIWVTADKLTSSGSFVENNGGLIDVTTQQYEDHGIISHGVFLGGGATVLHGGVMTLTNNQISVNASESRSITVDGTLVANQPASTNVTFVGGTFFDTSQALIQTNWNGFGNWTTNLTGRTATFTVPIYYVNGAAGTATLGVTNELTILNGTNSYLIGPNGLVNFGVTNQFVTVIKPNERFKLVPIVSGTGSVGANTNAARLTLH